MKISQQGTAVFSLLCIACVPAQQEGSPRAPILPPASSALVLDLDGNIIQQLLYDTESPHPAGADGVYLTPDDALREYSSSQPASSNAPARTMYFSSRGPDQRWLTADDGMVAYEEHYVTTGSKLEIFFDGPGEDGTWLTSDDNIDRFSHEWRLPNGVTRKVVYSAGEDGVPKTNDDVPLSYRDIGLRPGEQVAQALYYTSPGEDGYWFSDDDFIGDVIWREEITATEGLGVRITHVWPGVNGILEEGDHTYEVSENFSREENGVLFEKLVRSKRSIETNTENQQIELTPWQSQAFYTEYKNGHWQRHYEFEDAGADEQWISDDDTPVTFVHDEISGVLFNNYQIVQRKVFHDAGADKLWETEDDIQDSTDSWNRVIARRAQPIRY